ncbi:hypothetical protein CRUP_023302 [Coryphaenoides rupestris]|nr:hypothetical protein CRUP_023302 [Coryphaenoides rupestris]
MDFWTVEEGRRACGQVGRWAGLVSIWEDRSRRSVFDGLPLTSESAVGSLLIIQPQRGRVTEGDGLIVIGQLWTPAPPTCKRGQRSNKSSQAQQGGSGLGGKEEGSVEEGEVMVEERGVPAQDDWSMAPDDDSAMEHIPPGYEAVSLLEALNGPLSTSPAAPPPPPLHSGPSHAGGALPPYSGGGGGEAHPAPARSPSPLEHSTSSQGLKLKKSSSK